MDLDELTHPKGTATERILMRDKILRGGGAKFEVFYNGDGTWAIGFERAPEDWIHIEDNGASAVIRSLADIVEEH